MTSPFVLQIHPEGGSRSEVAPEADGRIGGDRPLGAKDRRDSVCGHPDGKGQLIRAHVPGVEFRSEELSGVCFDAWHWPTLPNRQVPFVILALTSRFRLTPCSAACMARARCDSGGTRTMNFPL